MKDRLPGATHTAAVQGIDSFQGVEPLKQKLLLYMKLLRMDYHRSA